MKTIKINCRFARVTLAAALIGVATTAHAASLADRFPADRPYFDQASQQVLTLASNQPVAWANPANGHSGTVQIAAVGVHTGRPTCRELAIIAKAPGWPTAAFSRVGCFQADGAWHIAQD